MRTSSRLHLGYYPVSFIGLIAIPSVKYTLVFSSHQLLLSGGLWYFRRSPICSFLNFLMIQFHVFEAFCWKSMFVFFYPIKFINPWWILINNLQIFNPMYFNFNPVYFNPMYLQLYYLQIHRRLSRILKASKKVQSNFFWYVKVCIFWKFIQYTIHWDKTQMLQKFPSDKINGTKNALFFLSQAPSHHSFIFNYPFLYELKRKVCLSKSVCGIFHFQFCFVFIKVYIFVQQEVWTLWL